MKNKILLLSFVLVSSTQAFADTKSIEQMLSSMKFEKRQAEMMINRLVKSGRLNHDEALRAKREIASVQEESLSEMKSEALENINSAKSLATK